MIAEDEAARAQPSSASAPALGAAPVVSAPSKKAPADEDADEEMWDAVMADFPDEPYVPPERQPTDSAPKPSVRAADEDEEMWDIVREMEEAEAASKTVTTVADAPPSDAVPPGADGAAGLVGVDPTKKATNDEGWDEMYA